MRRYFWLMLTIAFLLRLPHLWGSLWYDESWTQWVSGLPWEAMLNAVTGDVHPPGYFALTWLLGRVSLAPVVLRLPSLIASLAAIWLTRQIARQLKLHPIAEAVALALITFSPFQIYYATDARMYALLQCAFLLGIYAVLIDQYLIVMLACTALLYLQNYGVLYVGVLFALSAALTIGKIKNFDWLSIFIAPFSFCAAFGFWFPWLVTGFMQQVSKLSGGYWIPQPDAWVMITSLYVIFFSGNLWMTLRALGAIIAAAIVPAVCFTKQRVLLWLALAPLVIAFVASWIVQPLFIPRPLIGVSVPLFLLVGVLISQWRPRVQAIASIMLLGLSITSAVVDETWPRITTRYSSATVATLLRDVARPDDVLYFYGLPSLIELHQYGLPQTAYLVPQTGDLSNGFLSERTRVALGIVERPISDLTNAQPGRKRALTGQLPARMWLIVSYIEEGDRQRQRALLPADAGAPVLALAQQNFGVEVYLYEQSPSKAHPPHYVEAGR